LGVKWLDIRYWGFNRAWKVGVAFVFFYDGYGIYGHDLVLVFNFWFLLEKGGKSYMVGG